MSLCFGKRKQIALHVLGHLPPAKAARLQQHLQRCPACKEYSDQISALANTVQTARPATAPELSPYFHARLKAAIKAEPQQSGPAAFLLRLLPNFNPALRPWRVAAALAGITILALAILPLLPAKRGVRPYSQPLQIARSSVPNPHPDLSLQPTIANYQFIANESLDKLDQLLTRQGTRNLPPVRDRLVD